MFTYIRGKAIIAALVACTASAIYFSVGLNLWLVFGVLAFWLNVSAAPPPGSDA